MKINEEEKFDEELQAKSFKEGKLFVKVLNKETEGFKYLHTIFPSFSDAKLKEGIFVGCNTRKLMKDEKFHEELQAKSFKEGKIVCEGHK